MLICLFCLFLDDDVDNVRAPGLPSFRLMNARAAAPPPARAPSLGLPRRQRHTFVHRPSRGNHQMRLQLTRMESIILTGYYFLWSQVVKIYCS